MICVYKGDKKAEDELDDRLLIPFSQCLRWNINSDDSSLSTLHHHHYQVVNTDHSQVRTQKYSDFVPKAPPATQNASQKSQGKKIRTLRDKVEI